ncbi:kinesin motor domain containing protein expressed [Trifolium pratense]|uniref:Kinesin motor domain containing protein expressed n=1 Tax=Trifolium pratense TaxID=57577 RepID=A0A2K3NFE7_TRIPR|nr:kinesin motor domain containing protein expressed [Trifolium pratense]
MTVRNITGIEVAYPKKTPLCRLMLAKPFQEGPSNGPIPFFMLPTIFSHKLEKTLTISYVESGTLTLFWRGFFQNALSNEETQLTLIYWLGNTWNKCHFQFDNNPHMSCKISGQWRDVCKIHRLTEGVTVKFGVTEESNNKIVYFKLSSFLGVRTTMFAPSTSGRRKTFYQSQHYFKL